MSTAPRTVNAYAAFEPCGKIEPFQYLSRPLGEDDVEIKISHCGICGVDIHHLDSGWEPTLYPCVFGHEIICEGPARPCEDCADNEHAYCDRTVDTYDAKYEDVWGIKWVGSIIGSIQDVEYMLNLASEKNVRAIVQQMPMDKVNDGIAMMREGRARYRVVLEN
ncbi:mannitol dehydrogenase [Phytophthora nicotianae]|uniref:Mannitol dehydrogenase n=1 Tax=Phytophthora nicotianae TaxID=4792 RepID=A0A0W8C643_PHYNI|nr:mannitol dehydrogenase [Phytophthora nicotianae]